MQCHVMSCHVVSSIYISSCTCSYVLLHYSSYRTDACGCHMLPSPWSNQSSIRFQGAIGYSNHRPPQAPQDVETVDAEQDSQRGGWQHVDYLMDPLTTWWFLQNCKCLGHPLFSDMPISYDSWPSKAFFNPTIPPFDMAKSQFGIAKPRWLIPIRSPLNHH